MAWYLYPAAIAAGFVCGYINTLAGSGSLITLPLLMAMGLPANVANGTNRVAIVLQNVVGAGSFRRQKVLDWRGGLLRSIPAVIGSVIGAQIAVNLDEQMMRRAIGALMIVMLVVILVRPNRWLEGRPGAVRHRLDWKQTLIFFAIGVYGGFIQAGVGIFLLAALVLGAGYDLVWANAIKVFIVLCFTASALLVFLVNGQVQWGIGLLVGVGTMLGAWAGARMAVERGTSFVRWVLVAVVVVSAADLLGVVELAGRLS
jgi:uncharacterized membrane protein YfcA